MTNPPIGRVLFPSKEEVVVLTIVLLAWVVGSLAVLVVGIWRYARERRASSRENSRQAHG